MKKPRPTYILLTIEEQSSLSFTLFNLNLGSLAQGMRILSLIPGAQGKPGFHAGRAQADPMLLQLARLILPMSDCLGRVDTVMDRLDRELESFRQAFDMIQQRFDRLHGMMDRILDVMNMMSVMPSQNAPSPEERRDTPETSVKVCACGRPIQSESGCQSTDDANANDPDAKKTDSDDPESQQQHP